MNDVTLTVRVNKKIGIAEWERFEQLADEKNALWKIFWAISNDKKRIKKNKICPISYFNKFVMPSLEIPMREFITQSDGKGMMIHKDDIETILSLYVKLIPDNECETCGKETSFIDKLDKHFDNPYGTLEEIMDS